MRDFLNKILVWVKRTTPLRISMATAVVFASMHLIIEMGVFENGPFSKKGLIHYLDLRALDLKFVSRGVDDLPEPKVVIAAIDEKSVARFGLWPWSRMVIADFINAATKGGAKVIGFDGTFSDEDRNASYVDIKRFHDDFKKNDLSPDSPGNKWMAQQLATLEAAQRKTQEEIDDLQKRTRQARPEVKKILMGTLAALEETLGEQQKTISKTKQNISSWNDRAKKYEKTMASIVAAGAPDDALARALSKSPQTVLGFINYYDAKDIVGVTPEQMAAAVKHLDKVAITNLYEIYEQDLGGAVVTRFDPVEVEVEKVWLTKVAGILAPLPKFGEVTTSFGFFNISPDPDGPMRRMRTLNQYQGKILPALSLSIAAKYLDGSIHPLNGSIRPGETIDGISLTDEVSIPTNWQGHLLINYYMDPQDYFKTFSVADFIDGTVPTSEYAGKVVLFGMTAQGLFDLRPTPFAPNVPGVYIHASAIQNILDGRYLERYAGLAFFEMLGYLLLGLLMGLTIARIPPWAGVLATIAFAGGLYLMDVTLVFPRGTWMLNVLPTLQATVTLIGINIHGFLTEGKEKRLIRKAFQFYLSKNVVDQVVLQPDRLKLGGEKAVCTILFSDVRGFTTISERLSPEQLVSLLNEYLTPMTNIVMQKYDGTLDKYIGDAIMAFYGAPIHYDDHAKRACWTAVDMLEELARLKVGWEARGLPDLDIGVGLNTGPVSVGNMGSHERFNYTVMGDHVNLASRLEGINKQYHTNIIISQFTFDAAKADIHAREMDSVRVKGKREPVRIYELLGKGPAEGQMKALIETFEMGITLYKSQKWDDAVKLFQDVKMLKPNDYASDMYIERCKTMQGAPPGNDWDGVFTMTTK